MTSLKLPIPYSRRLFLWLVGYSVLMMGCFVAFQYRREKEFKVQEVDSSLQTVNGYILARLAEGYPPASIDVTEIKPFDDIRVSIISPQGRVVYDNSLDSMPSSSHLDRAEIRDAIRLGQGFAVRRHSESTGDTYFYSARRGENGVIVRTAVPYSVSFATLLEADYGFIRVMVLITLAMCALGYILTRRVGQHVRRLSRFAQSVENGARISDTEPFPNDELGQISNHIVRLYARLQSAIADRDSEHRAAMHEHLEKERIKKQLTNNINHELKTPVASVRICIETLLNHPDLEGAKRREFLERALAAAERLQRLLADVSLITRMDEAPSTITRERADLSALIARVVADRLPDALARGIDIDCDMDGQIAVEANVQLMEGVFYNLIDNAVAYSGASRIRISRAADDESSVTLLFEDNGAGVAAVHLPHLFERFYRIDKGRSRAAGGTGLGLSIVKNTIHLHGGEIYAASLPGKGLSFRIRLPRLS